jgi:hypothetical protein
MQDKQPETDSELVIGGDIMARRMRKRYQRALNRDMRKLNKNIANDELWRGRFYFFQKDVHWEQFPDGSGGLLHVYMRGYDKATGYYRDYMFEYAPYLTFKGWHIWNCANDFITEGVKVWEETPRPSIQNAKDWTQVPVDVQKVSRQQYNYWYDIKSQMFTMHK